MAEKITKIGKLVNPEAFLQVNLVKGYKYVDRAGEIVNLLHEGDKPPKFQMDLNGLLVFNPDDRAETIKISSNAIWAHFKSPDSVDFMGDYFQKKIDGIIGILEVGQISRVGWRNYFVHEFNQESERDKILKKFTPIDNFKFEDAAYLTSCDGLELNIRLRKVLKNDGSTSLPGLLFDIDFYKQYASPFCPVTSIPQELLKFKQTIRSDEFLAIINSVLE